MKFSHKILLAAALVVAVAFACFILFNDYRQRQTLRSSTEASMQELGSLTTSNIQTWLESRIQLLQSLSQQIAVDGSAPGQPQARHRPAGLHQQLPAELFRRHRRRDVLDSGRQSRRGL